MITYGSLFSGVGGFDLGFDRAGMSCKWQVEIDEYARAVLAKHWPDVRRYEDVREVGRHNLEAVDVICGGFPCQPFSIAGKRRGAADNRYLWPEMFRIVSELKPSWVVAENVDGFTRIELDNALVDMESEGYEAWAVVLPASAVGAPHRRYRLFIIANSDSGRLEKCDTQIWAIPEFNQTCDELGCNWISESGVLRVADGVPHRVDRIRCLGNAVVPQLAELIGRRIVELS